LKAEDPKLFKEWRRRSLQVKFTAVCRMGSEEPLQDMLLPFFMDISPSVYEKDGATCEIELNFMSATGMVIVLTYPALHIRVKLTVARVF
jgi:hypothetical protein